MPRPDVARLGICYRRIPILAIGRDVYLDTRLQIQKLEGLFPDLPRLGARDGEQRAIERLLSHFIIDGGVFDHAVQLLPTDLPLLKDPVYYKDRADFAGKELSEDSMARKRPAALGEIARAFELLETTLLADGREWILKTEKPSLADIEAVWPFHWLSGLPGALPQDRFSAKVYPRAYAWIHRFQEAVSAAKKRGEKPAALSGAEAAQTILASSFAEDAKPVDEGDAAAVAQGLRPGDTVRVWPTDTGSSHRDVGKLAGLDLDEIVYETAAEGASYVRVHAPRHGFAVAKDAGDGGELAKL